MPWLAQTSFAAGEVDPSMVARTDLTKLSMAALTLRNRTVLPHGPTEARPGLEFIYPAKYSDRIAVLRPFVYSLGQNYVMEFGHLYVRFYKDGGVIVKTVDDTAAWSSGTTYAAYAYVKNGGLIYRSTTGHTAGATTEPGTGASWETVWILDDTYEIATPYTEDVLYELNLTQSADRVFITHRDYEIKVLTRYDHNDWALSSFAFENGPFLEANLASTTLACSATTGTGKTLTASSALFESGHVGSLWKLTHDSACQAVSGAFPALTKSHATAWASGTAYAAGDLVSNDGNYYRCSTAHTSAAATEPGTGADWTTKWSAAIANWSSSTAYALNVYVMQDNVVYKCILAHTSADASKPNSGADWTTYWVGLLYGGTTSTAVRGKGTWKITTHGTWSAKLYLEMSLDGTAWTLYRAYSGANDNNIIDEEDSDGLASYRVRCYEFTSGTLSYDLTMSSHEWDGIVKVTAVTNSTHATVSVIEELAATTATKNWCEGAWSVARGWPACSAFYQNRLALAGSPAQPETVHLSRTDDYTNFLAGTEDDAAISLPLVSRQSNTINAMVARKQLVAFTASGEFIIDANGGVMTPTTPTASEQESNGIGQVDPLAVAGNRVVFVAPQGNVVLDIGYNLADDSYSAKQLSIMAPHLFRNHSILDAAYQKAPESICWFVRDDGVLLGLTYLRDQEVWAWHRHDTDGDFLSVSCIRGETRNEVWAAVRRTIGGVDDVYIERLAASVPTQDPADQNYLDSSLAYSGSPITTVNGLLHLEGKTVSVNADGFTSSGHLVASGAITLPEAASKIVVGLPYDIDLELPNADWQEKDGTVQGRKKRLDSVILRVQNARGGKIGLSFTGNMDYLPEQLPVVYGTALPLFSGDIEASLPADIDTTARVCIRQTEPMPLTILAVIREVTLCDS